MAVTNSQKTLAANNILPRLQELIPSTTFALADSFFWSPSTQIIAYSAAKLDTEHGQWSLIHEVAHAVLAHASYSSDFGLLKLEVDAWEEAKVISKRLNIAIDENHIQDCLDTYRDWLHRRSTCPTCGSAGLQQTQINYHCQNCLSIWKVSQSRFCRPYRRKQVTAIKKSSHQSDETILG